MSESEVGVGIGASQPIPPAILPKAKRILELLDPNQLLSFLLKIRTDGGCWEWAGKRDKDGYGQVRINGVSYRAHRVSYEAFRGVMILPEMQLDHLCRNRGCVRPDHLEAVLPIVNTRRGRNANREKEACKRGHSFVKGSFYVNKGKRYCIACARMRSSGRVAPLEESPNGS